MLMLGRVHGYYIDPRQKYQSMYKQSHFSKMQMYVNFFLWKAVSKFKYFKLFMVSCGMNIYYYSFEGANFFQLQDIYIYFFIIFFHRYIFICSTTIPVLTVNWHWMIDSHLITEVKQLSPVSTWIWVHLATLGTVSEKSGIKLVGYGASYFIP